LAKAVAKNLAYLHKDILTCREAAAYMGVSLSYIYKLTHRNEIPHYKPLGKKVFFNKSELEEWIQRQRIETQEEVRANAHQMAKALGRKEATR